MTYPGSGRNIGGGKKRQRWGDDMHRNTLRSTTVRHMANKMIFHVLEFLLRLLLVWIFIAATANESVCNADFMTAICFFILCHCCNIGIPHDHSYLCCCLATIQICIIQAFLTMNRKNRMKQTQSLLD